MDGKRPSKRQWANLEATVTAKVRHVEELTQGSSGKVGREGDRAPGSPGVIITTTTTATADIALK